MKLASLQREFQKGLLYQESEITQAIEDSCFTSEELLQIYRNNFVIGTSEALAASYSKTFEMVGDEFFQAVARRFTLDNPPRQGNIINYGDGFAEFLQTLPQLESMPYIAELAKLEWQIDRVSRMPDNTKLFPFEELAKVPAEAFSGLVFELASHFVLFRSDFQVEHLFRMIANDNVEPGDLVGDCYLALVKQNDFSVALNPLSSEQYSFLTACKDKLSLAQIDIEDDQIAPLLQHCVAQGLLVGFSENGVINESHI